MLYDFTPYTLPHALSIMTIRDGLIYAKVNTLEHLLSSHGRSENDRRRPAGGRPAVERAGEPIFIYIYIILCYISVYTVYIYIYIYIHMCIYWGTRICIFIDKGDVHFNVEI